MVEEMSGYERLAMFFKEVGKIADTAARWSPILFPEGVLFLFGGLFVCLLVFSKTGPLAALELVL